MFPDGWPELTGVAATLEFERVPFGHPLWILYSSGTTGLPKGMVQSQGGILLEHLKKLCLHTDLSPDDAFFWFTTTGWMMWNYLLGGLLAGSTIVLYDGRPDPSGMWDFAREAGITVFGTSPALIAACMKAGRSPGRFRAYARLDPPERRSRQRASSGCTGISGRLALLDERRDGPLYVVRRGRAQSAGIRRRSSRPGRSARRSRHGARAAVPSSTRWASW